MHVNFCGITVAGERANEAIIAADRNNKEGVFKNWALFINPHMQEYFCNFTA